jgi:hypothetical protein
VFRRPAGRRPPAPLALTEAEVLGRIRAIASAECDVDGNCSASGAYAASTCDERSTYRWICYGWNFEGFGDGSTCDFREVVSRNGYNGLTATRDTSYGNVQGGRFYCHF